MNCRTCRSRAWAAATGKAIVKQAGKYADRATAAQLAAGELTAPVSITVCGSGNLGQIYFDLYPRRIKQNELDAAYPGLVDALVQHEGIGVVVVADEAGVPIALGKKGQRNLHTDQVTGDDPLKMYGDPDLRAAQVRRVADFPHVGDIMVLSTVYPDGTVAAMEELIGSHGGMGGEQTDSFLLHPDDMIVPATSNSADVFGILNARRGTPAAQIAPKTKTVEAHVDAWTPSTLIKGLGQGKVWIGRMLRTLVLDRKAYQEVARDAYMTGPALLIGLIGLALSAIVLNGAAVGSAGNAPTIVARLVAWPLIALFLMVTARVLGGKASYTSTFRVTGFAYFGYWLTLLSVMPGGGAAVPGDRFPAGLPGRVAGRGAGARTARLAHAGVARRVPDRGGRRGRGAAGFVPGRGHHHRCVDAGCGIVDFHIGCSGSDSWTILRSSFIRLIRSET